MTLSGRCICGEVTVGVEGAHDPQASACHCRLCQRWTGGVFLAFTVAPDALVVTGPIKQYQSTPFARRAFCGTCGTHLWIRNTDDQDAEYHVMPGLFDAALDWPLRSEIYADRAMRSIRLAGDHPRTSQADYEAENPHID